MPRHPPCALNNLTTTNTTQNQGTNPPQRGGLSTVRCQEHNKNKDARIHYTILKHQPNNPPTSHLPPQPGERYEPRRIPDQKHHPTGVASGPNSAPTRHPPTTHANPFHATPTQGRSTSADTTHPGVTPPVVPQ